MKRTTSCTAARYLQSNSHKTDTKKRAPGETMMLQLQRENAKPLEKEMRPAERDCQFTTSGREGKDEGNDGMPLGRYVAP